MSNKFTRTIKTNVVEMIDAKTGESIKRFEKKGSFSMSKLIRETAKEVGHNAFYPEESEINEVREMGLDVFLEHSTVVEIDDEPQAPVETPKKGTKKGTKKK